MECGGRTRTWVEVEGDPDTLIAFLHGSRQSGSVARNFTDRQFEALGPTVIYPDGVGRHFNDLRVGFQESARLESIDDVGFLTELISLYDARTVIGCGFSNGGQMLLRLLFDAPLHLHAAALFGASLPTDTNLIEGLEEFTPTPILLVQSTADPLVPYEGGESGIGDANRGETHSAIDSAETLAKLNGSTQHRHLDFAGFSYDDFTDGEPVRLVTVEDHGHMVPVDKQLDARLGPSSTATTGAKLLTDFLADAADARTR